MWFGLTCYFLLVYRSGQCAIVTFANYLNFKFSCFIYFNIKAVLFFIIQLTIFSITDWLTHVFFENPVLYQYTSKCFRALSLFYDILAFRWRKLGLNWCTKILLIARICESPWDSLRNRSRLILILPNSSTIRGFRNIYTSLFPVWCQMFHLHAIRPARFNQSDLPFAQR